MDTAHRAVTDLAPLLGACGFTQASPIAQARADLTGLLDADGVHDSLYRSCGISLLRQSIVRSPGLSTGYRRAPSTAAS